MSQQKVDRYKQEKANRKQTMKKQKRVAAIKKTVAAVVACGLIAWFGVSLYQSHEAKQPREVVEVNYEAVDSYLNGLNQ